MEGRRFRRGRVFVTQNCTLKCRCRKNGVPRCAPLCKTKRKVPVCGPDERLAEILDLFAGGRCTCETKTCISTASKWASEVSRSQNLAKQTQHFKAAYCNIVAHNILHTFGHPEAISCKRLDGETGRPGVCNMLCATQLQYAALNCCVLFAKPQRNRNQVQLIVSVYLPRLRSSRAL